MWPNMKPSICRDTRILKALCCKASHKHDRDPGPKSRSHTAYACRADVKPHRQGGRVQGIYTRLANYTKMQAPTTHEP
jgi:hypothetical protein